MFYSMNTLSRAPYDARAVANYLLDYADARKVSLTQISLLKLLYFCQGWYLFYKHAPLIRNEFEAWENGPVVRVVRDAFKRHGKTTITSRADKFDIETGEILRVIPNLTEEDRKFVEKIFESYQGFGPWELRDLTHEAGSPWDRLWNSTSSVARFGLRIKNDEILEHFTLKARHKSV
jgi:uncharacterized phage-associated protein